MKLNEIYIIGLCGQTMAAIGIFLKLGLKIIEKQKILLAIYLTYYLTPLQLLVNRYGAKFGSRGIVFVHSANYVIRTWTMYYLLKFFDWKKLFKKN
jgi:hypothetical protein